MSRYRLPDGTYTTDADEYGAAWHALAEPIERHMGWHMFCFDPGIWFTAGGHSVDVDTELALLIQRLDAAQGGGQ